MLNQGIVNRAGHKPGVLLHVAVQLLEVGGAGLGAHGDGVVEGGGELLGVPRIKNQAAVEALRGAGELGQDHDAVALLLAGDVLVAHEVHAVARRGDEAHLRRGIEGDQLVEGDGLVHEVDGHEFDGAWILC